MATTHGFLLYPEPKEHIVEPRKRTQPSTPVMNGSVLVAAAKGLSIIPSLVKLVYINNGFHKLRKLKGMSEVYMRYDPLVVPPLSDVESSSIQDWLSKIVDGATSSESSPYASVLDYHHAYRSGKTTPVAVVKSVLHFVQQNASNSTDHSKAWLDINVKRIMAAAEASAERWKSGKPLGVLDGVPTGVKDEVELEGYYKKCMGTKLQGMSHPSDQTSWCVQKWEEQGVIVMGKTNMHEIGMDTSGNNPIYGTPPNPYNDLYYPGGSSSGSASSVGSGILPFTLGCDGGGSIRIPSSWFGVYGSKTTHGWVSTRPYATRGRSVAVAGPIAANMIDLEVAWRVMAQPDPEDIFSSQFPIAHGSNAKIRQKVLGICQSWIQRADPAVRKICDSAIRYYKTVLGYVVQDISIPYIEEGQLAHAITILSEATNTITDAEMSHLSPASQILIRVSRATSHSDFQAAQRVRAVIMEHLAYLFTQHPGIIIVTPTTPNAGWPKKIGDERIGVLDGNQSIRNMEYIWLANYTGLPSISLPVGYVEPVQGKGKVPVGLMGAAEWGGEDNLIQFGYEGEDYLRSNGSGRLLPPAFVDILGVASARVKEL